MESLMSTLISSKFNLYQTSVFEKNSLFLIKVEATPKLARYYIKVHSETKGPIAHSMVSANYWLRSIESYMFLWYIVDPGKR